MGDDRPDPTARLIAFGFYDGATDGVLETHSGIGYRFDLIDDWPGATADTLRMFLLSPLPSGSFARLRELISPHCEFRQPYWVPSWWHLDATTKGVLDSQVDAVLNAAGKPMWAVAGYFLCNFPLRVRSAFGPPREAHEWARAFGLPARA
ncbi:MAG TPA: hypothetical protein VGE74_07275 [Gemmata sp.]